MKFAFDIIGARSKRPRANEVPVTQSSMRGGQTVRRNLSQEDRKVRRQVSQGPPIRRNAAEGDDEFTQDEAQGSGGGAGYYLVDASGGSLSGPYSTPSEAGKNIARSNAAAIQYKSGDEGPRNAVPAQPFPPVLNPTVGGKQVTTTHQREAQLLEAMALATPAEQHRLARDLAALRAQSAARRQADEETDLADAMVTSHLTPVAVHEMHTKATDWIGEDDLDEPEIDPIMAMRTSASLWFGRTSAAVKADGGEYLEQAKGMARHLAGQYGIHGPAAAEAFVTYARWLNRANLKRTADEAAGEQGDVSDGTTFDWGTEVAPTVEPIGATQEELPDLGLLGTDQQNLGISADEVDPINGEGDDRSSAQAARRARAYLRRLAESGWSIVNKDGVVVQGGFDSQGDASSALAKMISSGQHDTSEGLKITQSDPTADSDVGAGGADTESNAGGQGEESAAEGGGNDDDRDDRKESARRIRHGAVKTAARRFLAASDEQGNEFCGEQCKQAYASDQVGGYEPPAGDPGECQFCGQPLPGGTSDEGVVPSRHDESQPLVDGLVGAPDENAITGRRRTAWRPSEGEYGPFTYEDNKKLDDEYKTDERSPLHRSQRFPDDWKREQAQGQGRRAYRRTAASPDGSDWDDADKTDAYDQSGEGQSSLPVEPGGPDTIDPMWPVDQPWPETGPAEVPSTRAPNVAENTAAFRRRAGNEPHEPSLPLDGKKKSTRRPRVISYQGRRYVLAADDQTDDKDTDTTDNGGRPSDLSHSQWVENDEHQSGDALSAIPNVEVTSPNAQVPAWPWQMGDPAPDAPQPSGAADVVDVSTPGAATGGYPQPDEKQAAFRRRVNARRQPARR